MGKKDKKKGKGAEKTALKTEKKALNKLKKDLAAKGEGDIEKLIAESQKQIQKADYVGEELCPQPSPRSSCSLNAHPDKEELVLFGGEYFNGSKTTVYNDLYFYNIKKGQWSIMHTPVKPPPRSSHKSVVLSQSGGQLWVFGGEFSSPSRSVFHHYNDLWVFHFTEKRWEQIKAPGGPSSRSGHRMAVRRKQIVIFGGFHDSVGNQRYFNDIHVFNLDTYTWSKIEASGKIPPPRSACLFAPLTDGRILLYGGYSTEKVKKDVDKGITHTDMYYLLIDERAAPHKWKWVPAKPSGFPPSPRCGLSFAVSPNNRAYIFGGVCDDDQDENLISVFCKDLYVLELDNGRFSPINLRGKASGLMRKKRRGARDNDVKILDDDGEEEKSEERNDVDVEVAERLKEVSIKSDDIFTVTVSSSVSVESSEKSASASSSSSNEAFAPKARMNSTLAVKNGILYLYGGTYEEGDRQYVLSDFYSLDVHKVDEWRTIVPFSISNLDWEDSSGSESEDGDDDEEDDDDDDESSESDDMDTQ
ncbi:kelch domain-containing protein 4 [Caerostris darwini]|uniref:Kelch domain-containing protein 4 n=1 Tax=Caerostris darwini TaxID=1538125 RepID=A0AAV4VK42_9ARAC|nr:kelch domain-containing protein 4 [Caerostris darwini]